MTSMYFFTLIRHPLLNVYSLTVTLLTPLVFFFFHLTHYELLFFPPTTRVS